MANSPDKILGNLDFEDIKKSLIDYLKTQSIIKDYNFEASAIRTLIDLMAYNTFYYAYYMNMVASEMFLDSAQRVDSIISLAKPLGYTVPGRRSSTAKIFISGIDTTSNGQVPEHSVFYGVNSDGVQYSFRNLESGDVQDSDCILQITEGTLVNDLSAITSVDLTNQKYFILNQNVDISSIRVKVQLDGEAQFKQWKLVGNIGSNITDDNIYFIERLSTGGFVVQFGLVNGLGRSLTANDSVQIRYMISSGKVANDISTFINGANADFSGTNLDVGVSCPECFISGGGLDSPDINAIKFVAPKWFSAQGRAVTKSDYIALISESGLVPTGYYAVYGGEEVYPPKFGRVFISIAPDNAAGGVSLQNRLDLIQILRDYSVVTVFPELVEPNVVDYSVTLNLRINNPYLTNRQRQDIENRVKSYIQVNYIKYGRLDQSFDAQKISEEVNLAFTDEKVDISSDDFTFNLIATGIPNTEINVGTSNSFRVGLVDNILVTQAPFTDIYGNRVSLRLVTTQNTQRNSFVNLRAFDTSTGIEITGYDYGRVNIAQGIVSIPAISTEEFRINLPLEKRYIKPYANNINNIYLTEVEAS